MTDPDYLSGPVVFLAPERHVFLVLGTDDEPIITWDRDYRTAVDAAAIHDGVVVAVPVLKDYTKRLEPRPAMLAAPRQRQPLTKVHTYYGRTREELDAYVDADLIMPDANGPLRWHWHEQVRRCEDCGGGVVLYRERYVCTGCARCGTPVDPQTDGLSGWDLGVLHRYGVTPEALPKRTPGDPSGLPGPQSDEPDAGEGEAATLPPEVAQALSAVDDSPTIQTAALQRLADALRQ